MIKNILLIAFLSFYTALNSLECSVFFKQIKFNQFKFKVLRIVNF